MSEVFASRLKGLIEKKELQQKSVAASLGLSPARFSAYVCNKSEPTLDILTRLCNLLGCSSDYLLGLSDTLQNEEPSSPVIIPNIKISRDPLADLDPDLKQKAEGYLDSLRDIQAARENNSKKHA